MAARFTMRVFRGDARRRRLPGLPRASPRKAWSCSTSSTASRPPRPPIWPCRWNCKAGKCGSCSAEINGKPRLMCMTRMDMFQPGEPITVAPIRTFPLIKDLVTDVSFNYEMAKQVPPLASKPPGARRHVPDDAGGHRPRPGVPQVHRVLPVPERLPRDPRPRGQQAALRRAALLRQAGRARHAPARHARPRASSSRKRAGIGLCNITKCCTEVCPEHIHITDNAIIPLKERVVDDYYDPVVWLAAEVPRPEEARRGRTSDAHARMKIHEYQAKAPPARVRRAGAAAARWPTRRPRPAQSPSGWAAAWS